MLDACGELAPVVGRMLARDPRRRPGMLEIGELAGNCVVDALVGFRSSEVRPAAVRWFYAVLTQPARCALGICCQGAPA